MPRRTRRIAALALAAGAILAGCPKRGPATPGELRAARDAYARASTSGTSGALLEAMERYQTVAAASPDGPFAPEAAYSLGLIALDLHLITMPAFRLGDAELTRVEKKLDTMNVPPGALLHFAVRVFAVARDAWQGVDRDRAERALELANLRERALGELVEIAKGPARSPLSRFVTWESILEREQRYLSASPPRELAERAALLQRATWITLLDYAREKQGCAILAFLAKAFLGRNLDHERDLDACLRTLGTEPKGAFDKLVRAVWVRLEEFVLDRPRSVLAVFARRLLEKAPVAARRARAR